MGNRLTLPLLFLAVLLAGGAFFWLSGGERRSAPADSRVAEAPASPEAAPAVDLAPAAAIPAEPVPLAEPARVALSGESAPAAAPAPSAARAAQDGRLTGTVVDRLGTPIAGARVVVGKDSGFPLDLGVELSWLARKRTQSDAQGRFQIDGLQPGALQIGVHASGFAPFLRRGLTLSPASTELEPIALARGAILSGIVVDPNGRGVAGARIVRSGNEEGGLVLSGAREPLAVCADDGGFRIDELACGAWRFTVRSDDHPDLRVEGLSEEPGVEQSGLRWQLEPGATIDGTVTDVPDAERGQLEVRASLAAGGEDFFDFGSARVAKAESNGTFRLRGLRVGQEYQLQARLVTAQDEFSYWERSRSNSVTARAGETGIVLAYQPEAALTFTVHDARTRQPLERFEVESGIQWTVALTDEDGRKRESFPGGVVRVGGLRPGTDRDRVQLRVSATGYAQYERADVAVRAGQELDLGDVFLEPVPLVRVHVLDQGDGHPVAGAKVRLTKQSGEPTGGFQMRRSISVTPDEGVDALEFGEVRSATTDAEGWAELTSYEGESVTVSVKAEGYAPAKREGILLPRGEAHEEELRISRGGEVLVQVLDAHGAPRPGVRVEHRNEEGSNAPGVLVFGGPQPGEVADADGRVVFTNLAAGEHRFRLGEAGGGGAVFTTNQSLVVRGAGGSDEAEGWDVVQVVEGERAELTLRAAPEGSLAGRVREAGKVLAGASLRLEKEGAEERRGPVLPGMESGVRGKTDGEGRYVMEDVKEGRYRLVVEHPTRRMPTEFALELREGENTFDVDLALSIVSGRITDAKGKGLADVQVWPERRAAEGGPRVRMRMVMLTNDGDGAALDTGGLGERARTDAEGRYTLRGVTSDADLVIKAEGDTVQPGESLSIRLAPDEVKENVDLALEPAGSIRVEATLADGAPARFQVVQANFQGKGEKPIEPKISFIQQGSTVLKGLRPGVWKVSVRNASAGPGAPAGPEQEIEVAPGEEASATFEVD